MKRAETHWMDAIPQSWHKVRNKELLAESVALSQDGTEELLSVSHLTGITPKSEKKVTMIEAESLEGYRLVEPGDLVINMMWAWMGALGVSRHAGIVSPAYSVYRPKPGAELDTRYFNYLYRSDPYVAEMTRYSRGIHSSRLRIYPNAFLNLLVPQPRLAEQRAIADYLDRETARIDTLVEEQQRLIELAQERRNAVLESEVARLEWRAPLGTAASLVQTGPFGSQLKSDEYEDDGVPLVNPSHLIDGKIVPDPRVAVSEAKASELNRHALQVGDVVLARRGELGRCAVVDERSVGFLCGTGSALIRPDATRLVPSFLAQVFGSRRNKEACLWLLLARRWTTSTPALSRRSVSLSLRSASNFASWPISTSRPPRLTPSSPLRGASLSWLGSGGRR